MSFFSSSYEPLDGDEFYIVIEQQGKFVVMKRIYASWDLICVRAVKSHTSFKNENQAQKIADTKNKSLNGYVFIQSKR